MSTKLLGHLKRWSTLVAVATALVLTVAAPSVAVPPDPTGPVTMGSYTLKASYNGSIAATTGWKVTWQIPQHSNQAWMAVGQWYYNLETGIYYTDTEGWWVYYYGDDDGRTDNNASCFLSWDAAGGHCTGAMANLQPGQQVTFTYQKCNASHVAIATGTSVCAWVNMNDGQGDRFLAGDAQSTVEMYTHDVETFGDTGAVEPIIPCTTPVKMLGQSVKTGTGSFTTMTGNQWTFEDPTSQYKFQNVTTTTNPATWQACSEAPPCPTAWSATTPYTGGSIVGYNGHKYRARWWTQGETPGVAYVWEDQGVC